MGPGPRDRKGSHAVLAAEAKELLRRGWECQGFLKRGILTGNLQMQHVKSAAALSAFYLPPKKPLSVLRHEQGASTGKVFFKHTYSKKFSNFPLSFLLKEFSTVSFLVVSEKPLMYPTLLHLQAGTDPCGPHFPERSRLAKHLTWQEPAALQWASSAPTQHRERQD